MIYQHHGRLGSGDVSDHAVSSQQLSTVLVLDVVSQVVSKVLVRIV